MTQRGNVSGKVRCRNAWPWLLFRIEKAGTRRKKKLGNLQAVDEKVMVGGWESDDTDDVVKNTGGRRWTKYKKMREALWK